MRTGIVFINTNIIPFFRIQNIDISEGFIMRKFRLATVTLSTAGGNSELLLINKDKAEEIKHLIKERRNSENLNQIKLMFRLALGNASHRWSIK